MERLAGQGNRTLPAVLPPVEGAAVTAAPVVATWLCPPADDARYYGRLTATTLEAPRFLSPDVAEAADRLHVQVVSGPIAQVVVVLPRREPAVSAGEFSGRGQSLGPDGVSHASPGLELIPIPRESKMRTVLDTFSTHRVTSSVPCPRLCNQRGGIIVP